MEEVEKKTLAVCIMSKDDEECLRENIDYHSLIGVEHFFIYDNNSKAPLKKTLKDYNNVTVIKWTDNKIGSHCRSFLDCIKHYVRNKFKWVGFIDTDEFIVMKDGNTDLKEFLKPYSCYGGLGINWKMFGSSMHQAKQKSVIESFTHVISGGGNSCIKIIANIEHVDESRLPGNPHNFYYRRGKFSVNEHQKKISSKHANAYNIPPTHDKIQINHYICRSKEEWEAKKNRGGGNRRKPIGGKWERYGSLKTKDEAILDLIEKIRSRNND